VNREKVLELIFLEYIGEMRFGVLLDKRGNFWGFLSKKFEFNSFG
jgi:hypothetical protein